MVIGETKTLDVQITNASRRAVHITSIAVSVDAGEFSETNDCPESLPSGASCVLKAFFHPLNGGGYHGEKKAIYEFYQSATEIAYIDATGQAL